MHPRHFWWWSKFGKSWVTVLSLQELLGLCYMKACVCVGWVVVVVECSVSQMDLTMDPPALLWDQNALAKSIRHQILYCLPTKSKAERFPEFVEHLSILAWKISWAEEAGRLQSMGLQRVGHNLEIKQQPSRIYMTLKYQQDLVSERLLIKVKFLCHELNCCLVTPLCLTFLQPHGL